MSTKPCPQCGAAVPLSARFCGQCGNTFPAESPHEEPTDPGVTSGQPTSRAPFVAPPSHPTPPAGSLASPAVGSASAIASAAPYTPTKASSFGAGVTMLGHAVDPTAMVPRQKETLLDSSPFGAQPHEDPATSRRPTPMVPPPDLPPPANLDNTSISGPHMRKLVEEELARAGKSEHPPAVEARPGKFGQTLLLGGVAPFEAPPMPGPPVPSPGLQSPARPVVASTMLGMQAVEPPPPLPPGPSAQQLPPQHKTMLGVALPGIAPTHDAPAHPPTDRGRIAGTLVGIAAPGIAPSAPGMPGSIAPPMPPMPAPPILPAPAPLQHEPLPQRPVVVAKKGGVPAIAVVAIVAVLVLGAGGVAAFFALRSGPSLTAQPQLDESGKESLRIQCESCADGTTVTLGASTATLKNKAAVLALPAPLKIGDNELAMKVDRPGSGRDETVKVHVPVAYRVKADLTTLTAQPPAVTVRVEATPGSEVTVDGKPVALDASGNAAYALDVTSDVEGPSDAPATIDKKIPFTVKAKKDAAAESGQLVVRTGVVPLRVDAPGVTLYTDHPSVILAGTTRAGGTVTVDGQGVAVDAAGHFGGVRVDLPASGAKTLTFVANAPPLAPRTVRATVNHVATLDAAAATLDAKAPLAWDAIAADPAKNTGKLVVLDAEVAEAVVSGGHTVLFVDEKTCKAASCVAMVSLGDETKAATGDAVRVYGTVRGMVTAKNGKSAVALDAMLVLPKAKK